LRDHEGRSHLQTEAIETSEHQSVRDNNQNFGAKQPVQENIKTQGEEAVDCPIKLGE
jgi:hypothetical protein